MTNGKKQMCGKCGQKSWMKNKKSAQMKLKNNPSPDDDDDSNDDEDDDDDDDDHAEERLACSSN